MAGCAGDGPHVGEQPWSLGYGDTNATGGVLNAGSGNDTYRLTVAPDSDSLDLVGVRTLGAGNVTGTGLFLDEGGNDTYNATSESLGYGADGLGAFADTGTLPDTYRCASETCYGYGSGLTTNATKIRQDLSAGAGLGAFFDGPDGDDAPEDSNDSTSVSGDLGIAVDE